MVVLLALPRRAFAAATLTLAQWIASLVLSAIILLAPRLAGLVPKPANAACSVRPLLVAASATRFFKLLLAILTLARSIVWFLPLVNGLLALALVVPVTSVVPARFPRLLVTVVARAHL
jgi:hypothetical protein